MILSASSGPLSFLHSPSLFRDLASHFSLLPTHLEAIVEDPMAPQQPGCPFKGTGRSREVKPLRWAGDDSQGKGRCPLAVQEVYPHLGEKATIPQSWPPGEEATHPAHPTPHTSQGGKMTSPRLWPGMLPLLTLGGTGNCKFSYFFSSFRLGLAVDSVRILVPGGSLPLAHRDIFSLQRQGPLESPPCSHIQDLASSLEYPSSSLLLPSPGTRWALTCNSHHRV